MLRSIENIKFCSYLQCRWLNVWRVNFYFNTLSCLNYFFPEIMGGVQNGSGNSKGVGGYFSGQKMEIVGRRGALREIPSVVGVWIFSGTTHNCNFLSNRQLSRWRHLGNLESSSFFLLLAWNFPQIE